MAVCPECEADVEIDEFDVDKGEMISCPECGVDLEVVGLSPAGAGPRRAGRGGLGRVTTAWASRSEAGRPRAHPQGDGLRGRGLSGGVDSAYLAVGAHRVAGRARARGDRRLGVARRGAARAALEVARGFGFPHRLILTRELENPLYARNDRPLLPLQVGAVPPPGCRSPRAEGFAHVAYGLIVDDLGDYRPGQRAAAEAGVRAHSPRPAWTKDDVRELSRALGLPTWDLPASPCLSSRVAYGTAVTARRCGGSSGPRRRCARSASGSCACGTWARRRASRSRARRWAASPMPRCATAVEQAVRAAGYARGEDRPRGLSPGADERGAARGARSRA